MSLSPLNPNEGPFSRQQQTRASYATAHSSSQDPSEAKYHGGQMCGDSYNNKVPPQAPYTSADPSQPSSVLRERTLRKPPPSQPLDVRMDRPLQGPPHLDVPRDTPLQGPPHGPPSYVPWDRPLQGPPHLDVPRDTPLQGLPHGLPLDVPRDRPLRGPPHGQPHYPYQPNFPKPPTSSHLRSSPPRRSGFPQNQSPESWGEESEGEDSDEHQDQAAHPASHRPRGSVSSSSQGTNPPCAHVSATQPPVSNNVPRENRSSSFSTERTRQISAGFKIPGFELNFGLAYAFVYTTCMISEFSTILSGPRCMISSRTIKTDEILPTASWFEGQVSWEATGS
jgi:hypothetical protein